MDKFSIEKGEPSVTELLQRDLERMDPQLEAASRQLAEEVAGLRYVIRRTFGLAMAANEAHAYATLVDVYGRACVRLVKLIKSQGSSADRMKALIVEYIKAAVLQVQRELGLLPDETWQANR
jgi:hypothetical protein